MGHRHSKTARSATIRSPDVTALPSNPLEHEVPVASPPPAYAPKRNQNGPDSASKDLRSNTKVEITEDVLATLRRFDVIFLVDDSGSMANNNSKSWAEVRDRLYITSITMFSYGNQARAALASLAEKAGQYDTDGIDVYFLNNDESGRQLKAGVLYRIRLLVFKTIPGLRICAPPFR